jgi:membrane fusion protein YbhG
LEIYKPEINTNMQRINLVLVISVLFFASCSFNDERSDAYGNFESTEVIVSSQAMGEIKQLGFEEGDVLERNSVVGIIDTTDLVLGRQLLIQQKRAVGAQLKSINSEIEVQQQQLQNNLITQERTQNLFKKGAATQKQMDDINGLVDLNRKQIDATKSKKEAIIDQMSSFNIQVEQINDKIDKCLVKNPVNGTVLVKYAEKGELATIGKPLYKLADLETMNLKAYLSGDQLSKIKIGQQVEVLYDKDKTENSRLKGIVTWIASNAEFTPKTIQTKEERVNLVYAVKVAVQNDGSIKIGMPGEFNFINKQ